MSIPKQQSVFYLKRLKYFGLIKPCLIKEVADKKKYINGDNYMVVLNPIIKKNYINKDILNEVIVFVQKVRMNNELTDAQVAVVVYNNLIKIKESLKREYSK